MRHQPLGQAHEQDLRLDALAHPHQLAVEEHDQVDVAGIVELARAELAHAEHDPAGALVRRRRIVRHDLAGLGRLAQDEAHGGADRGIGEIGQRARHRDHVPDAAEIGERGQQRHLLPRRGGASPSVRPRCPSARPRPTLPTSRRMRAAGSAASKRGQPRGIVEDQRAQEGRAVHRGRQKRRRPWPVRRPCRWFCSGRHPSRRRSVPPSAPSFARPTPGDSRGAMRSARVLPEAVRFPGTEAMARSFDRQADGDDEARIAVAELERAMVQARDRRDKAQSEAASRLRAALLEPDEALQHPLAVRLGMPGPLSATRRMHRVAVARRRNRDRAAAWRARQPSPYLMALSTRLASAWPSSSRLPLNVTGSGASTTSSTPFSSATGS